MKAVLDVHYGDLHATAACVVFEAWSDARPISTHRSDVPDVRPYRSGRFFERELPCLLAVLEQTGRRFSHIIIDGYVHLKGGAMGLGAHLHDALTYPTAVIGVAKNPLAAAEQFAPIERGRSVKPLFVSTIDCALDEAAAAIISMHGPFRIPTLLRLADRIARGG